MTQTLHILHQGKKIPFIISECADPVYREQGAVHVFCEAANIDQDHMLEDIGGLLASVPELIDFYQSEKKQEIIRLRVTSAEKAKMLKLASERGYKTLSSYLRNRAFA